MNKNSDMGTLQKTLMNEYQKRIQNVGSQYSRNILFPGKKSYLSSIAFSTYEEVYGQKPSPKIHMRKHMIYAISAKHLKPINQKRHIETDIPTPINLSVTSQNGFFMDPAKTASRFFNTPKNQTKVIHKSAAVDSRLLKTYYNALGKVRKQPNPSLMPNNKNIYKKIFGYLNEKQLAHYIIK